MPFWTDTFLCLDVQKKSNFRPDIQNQQFSVGTLNFVLKGSTIGPMMHRNAIKHENIVFREGSAPKVPKKVYSLSTRYSGFWT